MAPMLNSHVRCLVVLLISSGFVSSFVPGQNAAFTRKTDSVAFTGTSSKRIHSISGRQHNQFRVTQVDEAETATTATLSSSSSKYYSIESSNTGPAEHPVHKLTFHGLPGMDKELDGGVPPIVIETGKIGRQAAGAVTLTRGDTVLYSTAARDDKPKEEIDFLPLSVEYQERFSSAGMTSGSYNRRDGRPAEHEILVCRLIDRPIRPLIESGWRHETQLLSWVLSYDGVRSCDPLAILSSSASLYISDIPLSKPVAAVQVGLVTTRTVTKVPKATTKSEEEGALLPEGEEEVEEYDEVVTETTRYVINPSHEEMESSSLNLIVAGTKDAVLMIEGAADFLPESSFIEAVRLGQEAIKVLCEGLEELGNAVGMVKNYATIRTPPEGLQQRVDELMTDRIDAMYSMSPGKEAQGAVMSTLQATVVEELEPEFPEQKIAIKGAFKDLLCRRMFARALDIGLRCDGRKTNEIRRLDMEVGFLPRVHGSAIFTRGETQVVATTTLGDAGMRQKIDKLDGLEEKRFYLQYTFPPSCVGETGRVGAPGRREVGHGNLAERALVPALPSETDFPYTIRVESLVTESHGSSSMASVCGGCLALMDAGVPIKGPIAGIAMGMLLGDKSSVASEGNAIILSDISGTEDSLGTMDFKVAGDREGITTFQLDIKCEGLSLQTMERALEQAREGRLHLLTEMEKVLAGPREQLPETVPKMQSFTVPADSVGKIIGPGGKQIRSIIEDFELVNMDVNGDEGRIQMSSFKHDKLKEAQEFVMALIGDGGLGGKGGRGKKEERPKYGGPGPVEGQIYTGKITGIHPFGVFVEIMPGAEDGSYPGLEGLVHVSELARERVRNCEAFMRSMNVEELTVKYLGKDKGKLQLSRKAVLEDQFGGPNGTNGEAGNSRNDGGNNGIRRTSEQSEASPSMSEDELDVIAQAIEGITEI